MLNDARVRESSRSNAVLAPRTASERRRSERRAVALPVDVHVLPDDRVRLVAKSASLTGLFIETLQVPPEGFALHVTVHLEGGPLEAVATVVRAIAGRGVAVRLSVPGSEARARWSRALDTFPLDEVLVLDVVEGDPLLQHAPEADGSATFDPRLLFDFTWTNEGGAEPHEGLRHVACSAP